MSKLADELKRVQDEKSQVRDDRATAIAERDQYRGTIEDQDAPIDRDSDEFKSAKEAARKAGELGDQLTDLTTHENELLVLMGRGDEIDADGGNGPEDKVTAAAVRSNLAQRANTIVEESAETFQLYAQSSAQTGKRLLGQLTDRDQAAELLRSPSATTVLASDVEPLVPRDERAPRELRDSRLRFLDLLPIGTTSSNSIETVIEQPTALAADMVADDGTTRKPEEAIEFLPGDFPVRTVAAWIKIHKHALEDAPRVRGLINRRLPNKLRKRLELQALAGNPSAPGRANDLRGISNTSGIGVETQSGGEPDVEAILDALTLVIMSDYDPNFVALSAPRWASIRKMREEANAGQYLFGSPAVAGQTTVWGVPSIASASIANNRALVGDSDGAELTVRSGIQVLLSDSDGEDFTHNRVTVLAEGRFGLPVEEPGAFARVEFS